MLFGPSFGPSSSEYVSHTITQRSFDGEKTCSFQIDTRGIDGLTEYNASIYYDRLDSPHTGNGAHANWTYSHNAFYPVGSPTTVGNGWTTNYVTGDPKLPGEPAVDWDGQSGAGYYNAIEYTTDLYPTSGALIGAGIDPGAGFEETFLTTGTDFSDVLNGASAFTTWQQATSWDIGPWARGTSAATYPLQGAKLSGAKYN